ncbi:amidase [Microbacterium soli]|uniref:Amidase n=2 Tax=Microbacterium soli TaxID=446075 RepID=A0ABP7N148_9MICO
MRGWEAPPLPAIADPVAEIEAVLANLEGAGRAMGAVEELFGREARQAAADSRRRLAEGVARPLEGLAFGVKDVIQVEGTPTTFGSPAYTGYRPKITARVVRNLRAAGAILVAKLATYEFASGPNARTRNPWDPRRRSGGSSSGSASAIGAGLLPLALGTDSGGSIRVPAAWCGAVGFKPTRGRVPTEGVPPLSWHLDHTGTLTQTVIAAAAVFGHLAGEPVWAADVGEEGPHPLEGMTIGVLGGWFQLVDTEVAAATEEAIAVLGGLGARLVPVEFPLVDRINPDAIKRVLVDAESAALHDPSRPGYGPVFAQLLESGSRLRAVDYIHALRLGSLLAQGATALFDGVDALVCATSAVVAPFEEEDAVTLGGRMMPLADVVARNTSIFNISGHPALTVPSGAGPSTGMPTALQIIAPHWRDDTCFRIGMAYQSRAGTIVAPVRG